MFKYSYFNSYHMNTCTCIICVEIDINSLGTGIFLIWCEHSELFIVLKQCETNVILNRQQQNWIILKKDKRRQKPSHQRQKRKPRQRGAISKKSWTQSGMPSLLSGRETNLKTQYKELGNWQVSIQYWSLLEGNIFFRYDFIHRILLNVK